MKFALLNKHAIKKPHFYDNSSPRLIWVIFFNHLYLQYFYIIFGLEKVAHSFSAFLENHQKCICLDTISCTKRYSLVRGPEKYL